MKLKLKNATEKKSSSKTEDKPKRGRTKVIGGDRFNFFPGEDLIAEIEELAARCRKNKVPVPTKSMIFRQGAKMYIRDMRAKLKRAGNGEFHAKKRKN